MLEFRVQDMTCNHCAGAITQAVKQVAPLASVKIDLELHLVRIQGQVQSDAVKTAIAQAGYTPEAVGG